MIRSPSMLAHTHVTVTIHPATTSTDRTALENLMQFYVYDWSELRRAGDASSPPADFAEVSDEGRFRPYPLNPYFENEHKHAFSIRANGRLAGLALVGAQRLLDGNDGFDMAEFFVLRAHRRFHVGARAATMLFDRFRGAWQIRQRRGNDVATAFWRKTIDDYTHGHFTEVAHDDASWRGPAQYFASAR